MTPADIRLYIKCNPICKNCKLLKKKSYPDNRYTCGAHINRDIYVFPYFKCGNSRFTIRMTWLQKLWLSIAKYIF